MAVNWLLREDKIWITLVPNIKHFHRAHHVMHVMCTLTPPSMCYQWSWQLDERCVISLDTSGRLNRDMNSALGSLKVLTHSRPAVAHSIPAVGPHTLYPLPSPPPPTHTLTTCTVRVCQECQLPTSAAIHWNLSLLSGHLLAKFLQRELLWGCPETSTCKHIVLFDSLWLGD